MVRLENIFLKNVLLYLPTIKDIGNFAQVCKTCEEAILTIYINPFDLTLNHSFDQIIPLFPKLQTFYVRRCKERLYKIKANEIPLIEIGNWQESTKESEVFGTKWFASKIRKMRINGYDCLKSIRKNPEHFSQLQEVVFLKYDESMIVSILNLSTIKKATIICSMFRFKLLANHFDFSARKQTKYIIIFSEIEIEIDFGEGSEGIESIIKKLSGNCEFYTRVICKSTINLQFLHNLPYENKFFWNPNDFLSIRSDVFDQLHVINDLLKKNEIDQLSIEDVEDDFAGNFVDLSSLQIKRLSMEMSQKRGLTFKLPSQLESLSLDLFNSNVDISSCHLKEFTDGDYDGDTICMNDDNLEIFYSDRGEKFKWSHNSVELDENEMELDLDKIKEFHMSTNQGIYDGFDGLRKITIHKDGKTAIIKGCASFNYEGKRNQVSLSVSEEQDLDLGEIEFSSVGLEEETNINSLKVNTQNLYLLSSKICSIVIEGECNVDLRDCKIESITADVINKLTFKGCFIGSITAKEIKIIDGPKSRIKKLNVDGIKKGKK